MKAIKNQTHQQKRSKLGEIRMISNNNPKNMTFNPRPKNSKKNNANLTYNPTKKLSIDTTSLQESSLRPSINVNFKEIMKDISKEIPESLICNLCKNLVKNPTKCYQCKALFCKECLFVVLNKNKKCPKCFKIISKNLLKNIKLDQEFKNTFIKCKYTGCKESVNLFEYEDHLKNCAFKGIKDNLDIDNLVYFNSLPAKKDPYSNNILLDYSLKNAENEVQLNNEGTFVDENDIIQKQYEDWISEPNSVLNDIFKNIVESGNKLEEEILELDNKKKEVNDIIREMQSKIILEEMA